MDERTIQSALGDGLQVVMTTCNKNEIAPEQRGVTSNEASGTAVFESPANEASKSCQAKHTTSEQVKGMLGQVDWIAEGHKGYCRCPGADSHSSPNKRTDTMIYLDGAPTITCFHTSCAEQVREANKRLRKAIAAGEFFELSPREQKRRDAESAERERLELKTRCALPRLLRDYRWTADDMLKEHPFDPDPAKHPHLLIECFKPGDIIWIGERYDSGKEQHARNFRTREEWLAHNAAPVGVLTCPSVFKVDSFSRSNENVLEQRFLTVESDLLNHEQVGAVFRWMRDAVGMKLVAVVDTAGKSLHGWFKYPPPEVLEELKVMLPAMKCDPGMFRKAQPARIPGALRDGKYQRLLFLDKEAAQ